MKKLALTSLILVLVLGCKNSFSTRMTADYFPLKRGNEWIFDVKGENNYQITIEVKDIVSIKGDSLFLVDIGGEVYHFERKLGTVKRLRELFTTYEGERVDFGTVYEPYLLLPPIDGENWEREFKLSTVYREEILEKDFLISVDSVVHTSLIINSENYENVYHLKRTIVEDSDSTVEHEWFAPNIGLIKKEVPADSVVWELLSFKLNE
jgi:hypothetical protein